MLIYVKIIKKKKTFYGRTDGQPKTIVRNLTIHKKKVFEITFQIQIVCKHTSLLKIT